MTKDEIIDLMFKQPLIYDRKSIKPICVIYWPENYDFGRSGGVKVDMLELMSMFNNDYGWNTKSKFIKNDYWKDYYWFCFRKYDITEPEFKVFYEKDFTEIQYQELKNIITESIKNL